MRRTKPRERRKRPKGAVSRALGKVGGDVLDSDAFDTLNGTEMRILLGFLRRRRWSRKLRSYVNDESLVYTIDCMVYESNASRRQAIDGRNTLMDLGFIDMRLETDGTLGRPNVYALSDRFLKWHPNPAIRRRQGFKAHPPLAQKSAPPGAFGRAEKSPVWNSSLVQEKAVRHSALVG